jgi:hypothetical protein
LERDGCAVVTQGALFALLDRLERAEREAEFFDTERIKVVDALTAAESALSASRDEAARIADGWAAQYPEDVFHPCSTSPDALAAKGARHVARMIAKDIRALAEKGDGKP